MSFSRYSCCLFPSGICFSHFLEEPWEQVRKWDSSCLNKNSQDGGKILGVELIHARINPNNLGSNPLDLMSQQNPDGFFLLELQECLDNAARHRVGLCRMENDPVGSGYLRFGVIWDDFFRISLELNSVMSEKLLVLSPWNCTRPGLFQKLGIICLSESILGVCWKLFTWKFFPGFLSAASSAKEKKKSPGGNGNSAIARSFPGILLALFWEQ